MENEFLAQPPFPGLLSLSTKKSERTKHLSLFFSDFFCREGKKSWERSCTKKHRSGQEVYQNKSKTLDQGCELEDASTVKIEGMNISSSVILHIRIL